MNKKKLLKMFLLLFLVAVTLAAAFFYEFLSASGNMFIRGDKSKTSVMKEFSEMVISPSQSLKGEENGQINILLLGIGGEGHSGGYLTDTIMIASIKPQTREAALLSIPRDLYVEVEGTNIKSKINAVKMYGDQSEEHNGIELLEQVVKDVSGLPINYYVELDFNGFTRVIDAMGGIDVYLEKDIDDPAYPDFNNGYDPFYIEKGWHHLDGATALKVARSRHSAMGDFDRIKRQQEIIRAFRQKVFEKYSRFDVMAFKEMALSVADNMRTDIEIKELPRFYQLAKGITSNNLTAATVDTQKYLQKINVGLGYTLSTKSGDYSAINEMGANIFEMSIPEKQAPLIEAEGALIAIENGTGSPDLANTVAGDLEDLGFRIISSTNIAEPSFSGVVIRHSVEADKPETLAFLTQKFGAKDELAENSDARADFTIVLGKGF